MKAKSGSLNKINDNVPNGTNNANEGGVAPKKKSFGKGTVAPKPKAPALPHESSKPAENRNSRNSSGGKSVRIVQCYCKRYSINLILFLLTNLFCFLLFCV